jgi:hypothetical protein
MKEILVRKILALTITVCCALALSGLVTLAASSNTLTVTPANLQGWLIDGDPGTSVTFVDGPATPPLGSGSVEMRIPADGDLFTNLRHPGYAGKRLDSLTTLSYSTYVQRNLSGQAPYLILNLDNDGDGLTDDLLFFEPVYQNGQYSGDAVPNQCGANSNCVVPGQWQTWNALKGGWWSANDGNGGPPLHSIAGYLALYPNATIVNREDGKGGVRIAAGGGAGAWDGFIGNVDAFTIASGGNSTTYNFELHSTPANKDQCKNGGWATFSPNRPAGAFKNQGDCVSFTNTGK